MESKKHPPGTVLAGRYTIESILARGGMSVVYQAKDKGTTHSVAIKEMVLPFKDADKISEATRQFTQEATLLQGLRHGGLVQVLHFFEEDGGHYLVMELLEGGTLQRSEAAALPQVLTWADQVCDALEFLHSREPPILLRDLNPGNIMLGPDTKIRLIDFGIARTMDGSPTLLRGSGTAGFAALEQQSVGGMDQRTDIYALGATLYYLLTNQVPEAAHSRFHDDSLEPPSKLNPAIPPALDDIVMKAMKMPKKDRYETVAAMHAALKTVTLPRAPQPSPAPTKKAGCGAAVWLVLLVLLIAGGVRAARPPRCAEVSPQAGLRTPRG